MCGIAGLWQREAKLSSDQLHHVMSDMRRVLTARGPDDSGQWSDSSNKVIFGHQRLAIQDVSKAGHQPMLSRDERYVLTYNGEIYNAPELKIALEGEGMSFNGHSDSEALLAAITVWGIEKALEKSIGMFAFGLWDQYEQVLWLARDRLGIKPLYYTITKGGEVLFASQSRCFNAYTGWNKEIDSCSLAAFIQLGYIPHTMSIHQQVQQVPPATLIKIDSRGDVTSKVYWELSTSPSNSIPSFEEAEDVLTGLLSDAVQKRMLSDVPLGTFLSGGVDSTLVTALMQQQSKTPIRTFTVGFDDDSHNEAIYAKAIAEHLQTEHTELTVNAQDALDLIPKLPEIYDEPFADSSQIPTYLISQLTRQHVTVALSGDGGDEVFAGYNRYLMANKLKRLFQLLPFIVRISAAKSVHAFPTSVYDQIFALLPVKDKYHLTGDKMHKLASVVGQRFIQNIYPFLVSQWPGSPLPLHPDTEHGWDIESWIGNDVTTIESMQRADLATYLTGDILTKVDRASMANSLEVRVPLLDHRVVEYGFSLPLSYKLRDNQTKYILRSILYKMVPKELLDRPKMGFAIPLASWLRHELRDWAEALLDEKRLQEQGLLDAKAVRQKWEEHLQGSRNWQYALWNIITFQAWYENV